jgi:4-amino-4-deoxy-L-arabinose transferase-like glycosyltransferase
MTNGVSANSGDRSTLSASANSRDLIAISALALLTRLGWFWFGQWKAGDSAWYIGVARNIAFHHAFAVGSEGNNLLPTAFRPPLYPAMIAVLWFGEPAPVYAVLVLQVILGTATVALVYLIAHRDFDRRVALVAAIGLALAPMTGHFTAVVLSETLFTFLLTLGVFFWGRGSYLAAGLVFGLGALTRVSLLPFLVVLPLLTFLRPWRSYRRGYVTVMIVSLAIVSIWTVRNAVVFHRFVPVAAAGYGTNLFLGSLSTGEADNVVKRKILLWEVDDAGGNQSDESAFDRVRLRAALRRSADHPGDWLRARAQQYPRLFIDSGSYIFADESMSLKAAIQQRHLAQVVIRFGFILTNMLVFVFALIGIVRERARFARLSHLILFPLFLMAIALPLWIEPRYGLPMMPLIAILAAAGIAPFGKRSLSSTV